MEFIELNASVRKGTGKGHARSLRRDGKIPAILYGKEVAPLMLSVDIQELNRAMKKSSLDQVLLNLVVKNGETWTRPVMLKDIQRHPYTYIPLHVDLYAISLDQKINLMVPVVTKGKAKGVEDGGMLQIVRRELEVLSLPKDIPDIIEIDVTELGIGDAIHIKEVEVEGDVEFIADVNFTVVTVVSPMREEIEEEAEEGEEETEGEGEGEAGDEEEEES